MLNWSDILYYIKGQLALPSTFIEKADDEIQKWVKMTALKEFSDYIPDRDWAGVDPQDSRFRTGRPNEFFFFDDEELPILGVVNYYYNESGYFVTGHDVTAPMSFSAMKEWALNVFKSNMIRKFSWWGFTGKFIRPNIVRILPSIYEPFVIEYERLQPLDLRRIPSEHARAFMDLALAEVQIWLGNMRSHYGDGRITTPFGEIPLNGDVLKSDGKELKREVVDQLKEVSIPGILVDIG